MLLSEEERLVIEILAAVKSEFSIDSKRVYLSGQSNGGFGTWDMIAKRPDLFAAAIPLCGGGNTALAQALVAMPIWAFHGEKDDVIPVAETRSMIAAIKRLGGTPRYTEFKGADHDSGQQRSRNPASSIGCSLSTSNEDRERSIPMASASWCSGLPLQQDLVPREQADSHDHHEQQDPQCHYLTRQRFRLFFGALRAALDPNEIGVGHVQRLPDMGESRFGMSRLLPG